MSGKPDPIAWVISYVYKDGSGAGKELLWHNVDAAAAKHSAEQWRKLPWVGEVTMTPLFAHSVPPGWALVPLNAGEQLGEPFLKELFNPIFTTPYADRLRSVLTTAPELKKD